MEISARKKRILAAVVENYIRSAEPVGSKTIAETAGLGCSSATIRNELSELTALGYLEQPHTSAGRVPSPQGYRFYVNELMERQKLSLEETEAINARLNEKMEQLDRLMADAGKLAGQLTGYPALALSAPRAATVKRFDLLYVDANTFIIVALLSNSTVSYIDMNRRAYGLDRWFSDYVLIEAYPHCPTKSAMLAEYLRAHAADAAGADKTAAHAGRPAGIVIGDRRYDMEAARENGLPFIACDYGYAPAGELDGADARAAEIRELPAAAAALSQFPKHPYNNMRKE